jgi:hypothetical protein
MDRERDREDSGRLLFVSHVRQSMVAVPASNKDILRSWELSQRVICSRRCPGFRDSDFLRGKVYLAWSIPQDGPTR